MVWWKRQPEEATPEFVLRTVYDLFPDVDVHRDLANHPDVRDPFFIETFNEAKKYSLLNVEGFYNIFRSIEYLAARQIPGDILECGVFLAGAMYAAGEFCHHFGLKDRPIWLYDTFEGFPAGSKDTDLHGENVVFGTHPNVRERCREVTAGSRYGADMFHLVEGPVEETLKRELPASIALLRLDTDYYESTRFELETLYPLLSPGGVLIVDDYGHFEGVRRATDEYFADRDDRPLLVRVNYTVRCGVKP